MADDTISVELVAKIDQLIAGLNEAKSAVSSAMGSVTSDVHGIAEASKESEGALESILSIEKFRLFAEAAKVAFEVVKEAFESTIGQAEEFGLSNAKFAAMMGTSEEKAAGLSAALRGVGSSAEAYEGMALKLEMRLRTNEGAMTALGIATRDHSGALLGGQALMDNAIATMMTYKEGTDRNEYALSVFGRRASEVYDIMRVSTEGVQHQIEIYKELGVNLDGTGESSQKLEEALNDLHTMFSALEIRIGQKLMPVVTKLLEWMGTDGRHFLSVLADAFEEMAKKAVDAIKDIADKLGLLVHPLERLQGVFQSFFEGMTKYVMPANVVINDQVAAGDKASAAITGLAGAWDKLTTSIGNALAAGDGKDALLPPGEKAGGGAFAAGEGGTGTREEENPYLKPGGDRKFTGTPKKGGKTKEDRGPDEALKAAEKLALGEVAMEESKNAHLLAMGKESDAAYIAAKRTLADQEYNIKFGELTKESELKGRTELEQQKTGEEMVKLTQDYSAKQLKIDEEEEKQKQTQHKQAIASAQQESEERLKIGMAEYQAELGAGQITALQKANLEIQLTTAIRNEQLKRLDDELATLTKGTPAYAAVAAQRLALEKKFTGDLNTENTARVTAARAQATQMVTAFSGGFKTAIADLTSGAKSFEQSMRDTFKGILDGFMSMCESIVERWAIQEVTNTLTTQAEAIPRIEANAAVGASAGASSQAGIPIVGPALAVAAGASMMALILGYEALAHAEGGMVVDQNRLVFAHKEEMILPANLSRGVQSMIAGGGSGGGGGDINLSYAPVTHSASKDLMQLIREQPGVLVAHIKQLQRDGALR